ncbi:MAG: hypothetical protein Q8P79_01215 [Nanoarchaeota archaeon]|nr:hypothetical protein [Nanoarchaeota archaeon]
MAIGDFTSDLIAAYTGFLSLLPPFFQTFFNFFFLAVLIFAYATFVWKLHKFISIKNILNLDLNRYNTAEHPANAKIVAGALYFLEYIIIMPLLIFLWFSIFGISLTIFTDLDIGTILVISTVVVAAIRITAYSNEAIAREVAKLLPLNLLAISLLIPGFFEFERVLNNINQIPDFLSQIFYYLGFIILVEVILRFFEFIFSAFGLEGEEITKRK